MMKITIKALVFITILATTPLMAQTLSLVKNESSLKIMGTSSIHDWEIISEEITATTVILRDEDQIIAIKTVKLNTPVKSLKSGKGMMDDKTYKALKITKHPNISYQLLEIKSLSSDGSNNYRAEAKGKMTIAGITKVITHVVKVNIEGDKLIYSGVYNLNMTDYEVVPPTAMMGTIKTGKKVEIIFSLKFQIKPKKQS